MRDACVLLDGEGCYTVIGYEHIEYIAVTSKIVKISTINEAIEYKCIYFKDEQGLYMGIEDAMEYIDRLRGEG